MYIMIFLYISNISIWITLQRFWIFSYFFCILHPFYNQTLSEKWKLFIQKLRNESIKLDWTHRACAHNTLIALLGWEEVVFGECLPGLINAPIIPAGFHRSPQPCRNPRLVWERGENTPSRTGCFKNHNRSSFSQKLKLTVCDESVYLCILDSIAEAQLQGFHMAGQGTWLCYISHGLSKREQIPEFIGCYLSNFGFFWCNIPLMYQLYLCADAAYAEHVPKRL